MTDVLFKAQKSHQQRIPHLTKCKPKLKKINYPSQGKKEKVCKFHMIKSLMKFSLTMTF